MRLFRRLASDDAPDPLLGSGEGRFRMKHGHRIDLEGGCAGDGMGDPSYCQLHLADWYRASNDGCEARRAWLASRATPKG